jgi:hypothetical protein
LIYRAADSMEIGSDTFLSCASRIHVRIMGIVDADDVEMKDGTVKPPV